MSLRLSQLSEYEVSGTYSFTFAMEPVLDSKNRITSILAQGYSTTALTLSCKWYRIKQGKAHLIPEVTSK
jgi:hypothetical protein